MSSDGKMHAFDFWVFQEGCEAFGATPGPDPHRGRAERAEGGPGSQCQTEATGQIGRISREALSAGSAPEHGRRRLLDPSGAARLLLWTSCGSAPEGRKGLDPMGLAAHRFSRWISTRASRSVIPLPLYGSPAALCRRANSFACSFVMPLGFGFVRHLPG